METGVKRYDTDGGARIYLLPVQAFPRHITNCYLVLDDDITLIDTGSGTRESNESLLACFGALRETYGEKLDLADVGRVILTHGHIDHFGGLNFVAERSRARIGIHELDLSTVQHFEERLIVSSRNLQIFLGRAGLSRESIEHFIDQNKWSKNVFKAMRVDFTFDDGDRLPGGFEVFHTPGHCPGQVCLRLGDILFTADHVLERITPNQSPEFIIRYNGIGHYYEALRKIRALEGIRIGLGGHEGEIHDVRGRIEDIIRFHDARLERTLEICREPRTIKEIAREMFPKAKDYHVLLALTEAGAHVEYLHERGKLHLTNVEAVERDPFPVPIYQAP
jgi:glyoxylase-like metal-dependent hydrolase (beta-lactamase superfamily II)